MTQVASTILAQLGGNRFVAMTGAKNFVAGDNSLTFRLPRARGGINSVRIALDDRDRYTLNFGKVRGIVYSIKSRAEGVHAEELRRTFTYYTHLDTSL